MTFKLKIFQPKTEIFTVKLHWYFVCIKRISKN